MTDPTTPNDRSEHPEHRDASHAERPSADGPNASLPSAGGQSAAGSSAEGPIVAGPNDRRSAESIIAENSKNLPAWARKKTLSSDPMTDERMAAFIGPRWPTYERKFAQFRDDPTFVPTWNWSAAFFQAAWFLYRKLYLAAFAFILVPGMIFRLLTGSDTQLTIAELQKPENEGLLLMQLAVGLSAIIASGGIANWLLFRRAKAAVQLAVIQDIPVDETLPWLTRVGGINRMGVVLAVAVFLMSTYAAIAA